MKKLGYRKSRNGCSLCKRRRVKCDEQRPCSACTRHGVPCSLGGSDNADGSSRIPERFASQRSSPRLQSTVGTPSSVTSETPRSAFTPAPLRRDLQPNTLEDVSLDVSFLHASPPDSTRPAQPPEHDQSALIDLELMHHYSVHAYKSFPHVSMNPNFFQNNVPRLALRHAFLLHQILAVSAFHLIHLDTDLPPEYLHRATHHLTKSLSGTRAALTTEMTLESATALFAASSLLLSSTYASRQHLPADGILDDLCNMCALYRGIGSIQTKATDQLSTDIFQEIFRGRKEVTPVIGPWISEYIDNLEALKNYISTSQDLTESVRQVAIKGAQVLIDAPTFTGSDRAVISSVEVRVLYRWSYWVAAEFLQMIRDEEPAVLAVLLFYCAIMRRLETSCWFLKGWADRLAEAVSRTLDGTPWLEHTQWAFMVLGDNDSPEA